MSPQRIQRRRTKGWRMPEGAVYVGRGSKWGNPWKVTQGNASVSGRFIVHNIVQPHLTSMAFTDRAEAQEWAADLYRPIAQCADDVQLAELRGKDLACWCPQDMACHADVLLELANREE